MQFTKLFITDKQNGYVLSWSLVRKVTYYTAVTDYEDEEHYVYGHNADNNTCARDFVKRKQKERTDITNLN